MLKLRIVYTKEGKETVAPFIFDNIQDARQARRVYEDSGAINIAIVIERVEDNINN
jgi:hypothetical protein